MWAHPTPRTEIFYCLGQLIIVVTLPRFRIPKETHLCVLGSVPRKVSVKRLLGLWGGGAAGRGLEPRGTEDEEDHELSTSIGLSLLPDCQYNVTAAPCSCHHDGLCPFKL